MDLGRMLEKCKRDQWSVKDFDWSRKPREMKRDDEIAIVQLFTDMSGIERLAGALFLEQQRRVEDPTLKQIFATFVRDEVRHAQAAQMLADYYDVHHYKVYRTSPTLDAFVPPFLDAIKLLSDDVANAYITGGELILDIALLRSINDFTDDEMSRDVVNLINRDESRHIAIDYHMVEYYVSDEFEERMKAVPKAPLGERLKAWVTFARVIHAAQPFFKDVFFTPMNLVDPTSTRMREAIKRFQLLGRKPGGTRRPFAKFMSTLQDLYMHPVTRTLFGPVLARLGGVGPEYMGRLFTDAEVARAQGMTYDELADEAVGLKGPEYREAARS
jgi:hypothetical protein